MTATANASCSCRRKSAIVAAWAPYWVLSQANSKSLSAIICRMQWPVALCLLFAGSSLYLLMALASKDIDALIQPLSVLHRTARGRKPDCAQATDQAVFKLVPPTAREAKPMPAAFVNAPERFQSELSATYQLPQATELAQDDEVLDSTTGSAGLPTLKGTVTLGGVIFPPSTHECWWEGTPREEANFAALNSESNHTVCRYTNLLIWGQQASPFAMTQPSPLRRG